MVSFYIETAADETQYCHQHTEDGMHGKTMEHKNLCLGGSSWAKTGCSVFIHT